MKEYYRLDCITNNGPSVMEVLVRRELLALGGGVAAHLDRQAAKSAPSARSPTRLEAS